MDLEYHAVAEYTIFKNPLVTADLENSAFQGLLKADEFKRCISHVTAYIYIGVICALDTSFFSLTY